MYYEASVTAASDVKSSWAESCTDHELTHPLLMQRVLVEPVFAADGHTYNAWVMQPWLQVRDMSPCGGARLSNKSLVSNVVVRCLVYQQFILHDQI
jgi:hypothetical protein